MKKIHPEQNPNKKCKRRIFLGLNLEMDPSAAIVENGKVLAFSEEERHVRVKHAQGIYPLNAVRFCLEEAHCSLSDVETLSINWDIEAYSDGRMRDFYHNLRKKYSVDDATIAWQERNLSKRKWENTKKFHHDALSRGIGCPIEPKIKSFPHHYTHAFQAFRQSPFESAICLTIDGSGDSQCTMVWSCSGDEILPIYEVSMPHSLGWFYAAFTEYLGFKAYDGEYKVMGLAAYGSPDEEIRQRLKNIIRCADDGIGYTLDPYFIHYGEHSFSDRYTDNLPELLGKPPRRSNETIDNWHKNLAFEIQHSLEEAVTRIIDGIIPDKSTANVCIGGGVGLNVKMNSRIFTNPKVKDLFIHPLCSDAGAAAAVALLACYEATGIHPEKLGTLALGYEESLTSIEDALKNTKVAYTKSDNIGRAVAKELARGNVVAWYQGRMEAGPRALGQRSILANPTQEKYRDIVNGIVKFREDWRPFCPSVLEEEADRYFEQYTDAPYMILAFPVNDKMVKEAPAVVHSDGTARVQFVKREHSPIYHDMILSFAKLTGVPVVLNTSFNIRGEPVVCSIYDALRTFWGSGIDVLAAGDFLVKKSGGKSDVTRL